jgi:hypothetical protein
MQKTSIICFVEKALIPSIKEQFYTVKKFCHGYYSVTYIIEGSESNNQDISNYLKLNDVNVKFYDNISEIHQIVPHLQKAFLTLTADNLVSSDTDCILIINAAVMFFAHHTPSYFYKDDKIQLIAEDINTVQHLQGSIQNIKNRLIPVDWLFEKSDSQIFFGTERLFLFHRNTFKTLRNYMLKKANMNNFKDLFDEHVKANGSDLEILGYFAKNIETELYDVGVIKTYPNDLNGFSVKRLYQLAPLSSGQFHSIVSSNFSVKDFNEAAYQRVLADTKKSH